MYLDLKNPPNVLSTSLSKTGKDTKKVHVCSDRIKKAERLQIGNIFQTLVDLEDDDMDISHDIQNPPIQGLQLVVQSIKLIHKVRNVRIVEYIKKMYA